MTATCTFPGCGRQVVAKDLCSTHYQQARRNPGKPLAAPVQRGTVELVRLGTIRVPRWVAIALDVIGPSTTSAARQVICQWATEHGDRLRALADEREAKKASRTKP